MAGFIVIGAVGLAIVLSSLVLGEVLDGIFDAFDLDIGGGVFSGPVIGSFLAAFGFGAALFMYTRGVNAAVGSVGGLVSGAVVGGLALLMMRNLMHMPTDATPSTDALPGSSGMVITNIPAEGYGEVTVRHHGNQHKYNARATAPLSAGTPVTVTQVLSASSILVEPRAGTDNPAETSDPTDD